MLKLPRLVFWVVATVLALGVAGAEEARERAVRFDVDAQPLTQALKVWAEQADLQVVWSGGEAGPKLVSPRVQGELAPENALRLLLEGSGLTYAFVDERTVAISGKTAGAGDGKQLSREVESLRAMQLTQADTVSSSSTESQDSDTRINPDDPASAKEGAESEQLDEVVVTGTHIRGVRGEPARLISITRSDIDNTGFSTIEDVVESIPQNFSEVSPDGRFNTEGGSRLAGSNSDRASGINLRGLGAESTLTLINGTRRAGSIDGRVVDISTIPLSAIERIEVVTGGRSAIYGSDAVGGVVNLITRRDFEGAETQLYYGLPSGHDGGERLNASQVFGRSADRFGFVIGYDYSRDQALDIADTGLLSPELNPVTGVTELNLDAQADTTRHAVFAAGRFAVSDHIALSTDILYSNKKFQDFERNRLDGAATDPRAIGFFRCR
jgi:hypothetical protein